MTSLATILLSAEGRLARLLDRTGLLLFLCLLAGCLSSWALGQDDNWDLRNYHLYNAYALLNGRWSIDFVPASVQSFFNPIFDVIYFVVSTRLFPSFPRIVAAWQGTYFGFLVFVVILINIRVFSGRGELPATTALLASLVGVTAAGVVSEIGATFNDIPGAALLLFGVYLLIPRHSSVDGNIARRRAILAGVACGLAVGIKLTNGYYAIAVILAILISERPRCAFRQIMTFSIGCALSSLVFAGGWAAWIYHLTGNPVFPVFNAIFKSDWYPPADYAANYIKPPPLLTALFYPLKWTRANNWIVTEVPFRDARLAVAEAAGVLILSLSLLTVVARHKIHRDFVEALPAEASGRFVMAFACAGYVIWLTMFSVLRFGLAIEALTGTVIVLAFQLLCAFGVRRSARSLATIFLGLAVGIVLELTTQYPDWGRVPYGPSTFSIEVPALPANGLVVLAGVPLSYVVPFFPSKGAAAIGISNTTLEARGYKLFDETRARILRHQGPVYVVTNYSTQFLRNGAAELGVTWADESCRPLKSNLDPDLRWCVGVVGN